MTLLTQFELFIYSLLIGVYLGVTYDLFYYFILMHINKIVKYILIGGGVAIEDFETLFRNNFGENANIRIPDLIGTRHPKYSAIISGQYNIFYMEKLFEEEYNMVSFNETK